MKRCFKCGKHKRLSEFYAHPMMSDGHLGKCKECTKKDVRATRRARIGYYREYDRIRYQVDAKRRARQHAYSKKYAKQSPEKVRARQALAYAVKTGQMKREPCEICGTTVRVHGHHDDYRYPLTVRWLCVVHHSAVHHGEIP